MVNLQYKCGVCNTPFDTYQKAAEHEKIPITGPVMRRGAFVKLSGSHESLHLCVVCYEADIDFDHGRRYFYMDYEVRKDGSLNRRPAHRLTSWFKGKALSRVICELTEDEYRAAIDAFDVPSELKPGITEYELLKEMLNGIPTSRWTRILSP
jgi:hypothetical protein